MARAPAPCLVGDHDALLPDDIKVSKSSNDLALGVFPGEAAAGQLVDPLLDVKAQLIVDVAGDAIRSVGKPEDTASAGPDAIVVAHARCVVSTIPTASVYRAHLLCSADSAWRPARVRR